MMSVLQVSSFFLKYVTSDTTRLKRRCPNRNACCYELVSTSVTMNISHIYNVSDSIVRFKKYFVLSYHFAFWYPITGSDQRRLWHGISPPLLTFSLRAKCI